MTKQDSRAAKLDELDIDEFYDVWRRLNPNGTREEYEASWIKFQEEKSRKRLQ